MIVHRILTLFGSQIDLMGSWRIRGHWELQEERGGLFYLVRELRSGLPTEKAGLRVGNLVIGCDWSPPADAKTERDVRQICRIEAGESLTLAIRYGGSSFKLGIVAEPRPGL